MAVSQCKGLESSPCQKTPAAGATDMKNVLPQAQPPLPQPTRGIPQILHQSLVLSSEIFPEVTAEKEGKLAACAAHNQAHEVLNTPSLQGDFLIPETLNIWRMFWEDKEAEQKLIYVKKADLGLKTDFLIHWKGKVDELHK